MPKRRAARVEKDALAELFRLPQRLVVRTSGYLRRLGDLASQGSIEPREYIEESFTLWSGVLEEVGDWLNPEPQSNSGDVFAVFRRVYRMRRERADIGIEIPVEVFDRHGEDAVILLTTDGLIRTYDPEHDLRPALALAREQNVRLSHDKVRRAERNDVELKVFGLPASTSANDTYEGVVWGATEAAPQTKFPVAVVVVTVV